MAENVSCPSIPDLLKDECVMAENVSCPSIPDLFKDKCVLIAGATGFIGKVLLEKLLRSCPDIKKIYVLRSPPKKGNVHTIFESFLGENVFDRLRSELPDALKKIKLLPGDVTHENFKIESKLEKITSEVSFIFNCTEDLKFNEEPHKVLSISLLGVQNILEFSKLCTNLEALVHVSSVYAFCNYHEISEQLYYEEATSEQILGALRVLDKKHLHKLCMDYVKGRPELNNFVQAVAEILISRSGNSLPVIIVRPPIVTASVSEPFPGWLDGSSLISALIALCGRGIVRTLLIKPNVRADWVPVDTVANTLIVAAHYMAVKSKCEDLTDKLSSPYGVPIVHCTYPDDNSITWREIMDICFNFLVLYPHTNVYDKPGAVVTSSQFLHAICRILSHYITGLLIDVVTLHHLETFSLYKQFHRLLDYIQYFTTHSFVFHSPNMHRLKEQMEPDDRAIFPIDQSTLDWTLYMENYVLGIRRYVSNEDDESLPEARERMMSRHYAWNFLKISSTVTILSGYVLIRYGKSIRSNLGKSLRYIGKSIRNLPKALPDYPLLPAGRFLAHKFGRYVAE